MGDSALRTVRVTCLAFLATLGLLSADAGAEADANANGNTARPAQLPNSSPLSALIWTSGDHHRAAPVQPPPGTRPGFTLADSKNTGLHFINSIPESRHLTNQILLNGSGVAAGDVDGDGWTDVFFAGFDSHSALFRNLGDWRFEDVTATAGVALAGYDCTGATLADLDGDSDLDLIVNTLAQGTLLLTNDGRGTFRLAAKPLNPGRGAMTTAVADVDGDGFLDLYIANYRTLALMDMPSSRMTFKKVGGQTLVDTVNGRPATEPEFAGRFSVNAAGGIEEHGEPDVLYRNQGGMNFVEIPWTGGAFLDESGRPLSEPPRDWGLAAMFRDVNHDGLPDLYVCNDFQSPDRLWLNQGKGRFQLAPPLALRRTSLSSMAVDFADINRDGHDDFLVLEMLSRDHGQRMRWVRENFPHQPVIGRYNDRPQLEQNTLQLGRGDGTWTEIAQLSGLEATEWSWGCAFIDVDLDGWEDVLVVNGMERAARDLDASEKLRANRQARRLTDLEIFQARRIFPRLAPPNLAFRNQGDLTFREASADWGFQLAAVSQAIALADLDQDGDLDVLVANLNQPASVYRNDAPGPRLGIRLVGQAPNSRGIGARIEVLGGPLPQSQEMIAGGRYLAGDDPIRCFAALVPDKLSVRVQWPGGRTSGLHGLRANTLVEIHEPPTPPVARVAPTATGTSPIRFEDLTATLNHRHHEEAFDDFAQQPLLPHRLSQPGPGLAWFDLDQDGDDDLIVGAGLNGNLAVFRNEGAGRFQPWVSPALSQPLPRDITAIVALPHASRPTVLAALSNVEDGAPLGSAVIAWELSKAGFSDVAPATDSSPGPLALADIDADGDLDLFVGGRAIPGRWPAPATSRFLRNQNGKFVADVERSRVLSGLGLVNAAVFTDLDQDGDADLALALEWGPIVVLRQDPTGFTNITEALGLAGRIGWWTSIAAGDFDNDGRMDLVAGNWGRNTPYERHRHPGPGDSQSAPPLRLYHGDFNNDGTYDVIEAVHATPPGRYVPVQPLGPLTQALPFLRGRFPSHAAFGQASVEELLGNALRTAKILEATWLESTVFLNRGGSFDAHLLPIEAQMAPAFGIAVADADGDGNEDLFLAQNFLAVRPYTPRYDGGAGLWLRGNGQGEFKAISPSQSGVVILGDQRGVAVADFDRDGRIDLAVGQNGAETRLFRNLAGVPGITFHLSGPPENPAGVGAHLRWVGSASATREIRLGGGYLSQDALARPMARPQEARQLEVTWPGKRRVVYAIPPGPARCTLRMDGSFDALP